MAKKEVIALLLAGGRGTRLKKLTEFAAKPAVPFGGKYRIIDFTLSNCRNSGMDTVGILTQYQPHTLQNYINDGKYWDLDRRDAGITFLPPFQSDYMDRWYDGTANAIAQNRQFIQSYDPEYVLVLSGDHIYKMDYNKMLEQHKKTAADATISVISVPWCDAGRFGILSVDPESRQILEFEEKPHNPQSNLASMGIYIFNWKTLHYIFEQLDSAPQARNDFGRDIIPYMLKENYKLYAYEFNGYWKDVGTVESFWEANMDLLSADTNPILQQKDWPILTADHSQPPAYLDGDAVIRQSLVSEGCEIYGDILNSVVSLGVTVGKGSTIKNSVVLPNAVIGENVRIENAVIGGEAYIDSNIKIGDMTLGDVVLIGDKEVIKKEVSRNFL
ncbi:glucose-1-phosphate adenylyltransferase [Bacillus sp. T33-2]|uniref:glucose-1-phosphate adenylyltransferase n=1 Tax=Bacillus sp. T33-2 TaxID=2054168 RepID=UPI000C766C4B|nr:glucose-1-phosphate adenylyltransferase [Bacillus sp. T33-2]PLR89139.1 glucose-1-phosphate adenylyltransferase [Bacillus sp. T33-2]